MATSKVEKFAQSILDSLVTKSTDPGLQVSRVIDLCREAGASTRVAAARASAAYSKRKGFEVGLDNSDPTADMNIPEEDLDPPSKNANPEGSVA